jgi:hypothetical protein
MRDNTSVFDATRPVALQLRTPDGIKTVRVRFPSDDEWAERQRRRKVIIKDLGRNIRETTMQGGEDVDAGLLAKIRTEDGPEVDPFEAAKLIDELAYCVMDDVVPVNDGYSITLRVPGATPTLLLRMPSAKDVADYRRGFARILELPFGKQQLTVNLWAAAELFKKLVQGTEGYVGEPPIIHQSVAVKAAIDSLESAFAEDQTANF